MKITNPFIELSEGKYYLLPNYPEKTNRVEVTEFIFQFKEEHAINNEPFQLHGYEAEIVVLRKDPKR